MNRAYLVSLAVIAVLALVAILHEKQGKVAVIASSGSFMEEMTVENMKSGQLRWSMRSDRALLDDSGKTAALNGITVYLPAENMTVRSETGIYNMESRDLSLKGNVIAEGESQTIKTATVKLNSSTNEITTNDEVLIEGRGFTITGRGLRAKDNRVEILSNVNALVDR